MEEPFAAVEFVIDYALYKIFHKFQRQKGARRTLNIWVYIFGTVGLLVGLLSLLFFGFEKDMVVLMVILIFTLALVIFSSTFLPRLQYKHFQKLLEEPQKYQLFADHFTVETASAQFCSKTSIKYEALYKAYETDDMFYMYINKYQVNFFPKAALEAEATAKLRAILSEKLGNKFVF